MYAPDRVDTGPSAKFMPVEEFMIYLLTGFEDPDHIAGTPA
jgi:hypothetical protein